MKQQHGAMKQQQQQYGACGCDEDEEEKDDAKATRTGGGEGGDLLFRSLSGGRSGERRVRRVQRKDDSYKKTLVVASYLALAFVLALVLVRIAVVAEWKVKVMPLLPPLVGNFTLEGEEEQGVLRRLCRDCSFSECVSSQCSKLDDWYMCVAGSDSIPFPGCSLDPFRWLRCDSCLQCCNNKHCHLQVPTQDAAVCEEECSYEECKLFQGVCPVYTLPFTCTSGRAVGGCSPSANEFATPHMITSGECLSCCNSNSC